MIKSDRWIIRMAKETGMIEPFEPKQVKEVRTPSGMKPVISYGVSSYGYDIRVDNVFKILDPAQQSGGGINDPKDFDFSGFKEYRGDVCQIPAHGMAIVQSLEHFKIPRNVLVICQGKSTYARCGVQVSIAPLEPEWEGRLTFSITNTASRPARVYANEGIAQILFLESNEECQVSYADKKGKYQQSTVLTPPKV
jgi:dCTP deaminase